LARFDGVRLKVFDAKNRQLKTARFLNFLKTWNAVWWIVTDGGGLTRFEEDNFPVTRRPGLSDNFRHGDVVRTNRELFGVGTLAAWINSNTVQFTTHHPNGLCPAI